MGSTASKLPNINKSQSDVYPTTPISTPQTKKLDLDPRSPSCDIARTPIEVLRTPLNRNLDEQITLDEDLDVTDDETLRELLDPRSPTIEYHRTPIVIKDVVSDNAKTTLTLRNKNLDNARQLVTGERSTKNLDHVTRRICNSPIPPKLIDSSPITIVPATNKRNSVVGLLETNLDFVETDLDSVAQSKLSRLVGEVKEEEVEQDIEELSDESEEVFSEAKDTDVPSEEENIVITASKEISVVEEENVVSESEEIDNEVVQYPVSPKRQEYSLEITTPKRNVQIDNDIETQRNEVVFPLKQILLERIENTNRARTSTAVEELDRKLATLIYEDKQVEASSPRTRKMLSSQTHKARTPLSDCNVNQQRKVVKVPVLKVSDKPTKKDSLSKIPVFREKPAKGKKSFGHCENIKPKLIPRKTQWSTEDSMVI